MKKSKAKNVTTKTPRHQGELECQKHKPALGRLLVSGFSFLLLLVAWGLGGSPYRVRADATPNFNSQVAPILQKNCLACHSISTKMGGLVMESYPALM